MDGPATVSAEERELRELRARAYGPHADIQDDPGALARLTELEAARARIAYGPPPDVLSGPAPVPIPSSEASPDRSTEGGAVTVSAPSGVPGPSLRQRATGRRGRRWLVAGAIVVVLGLAYAVTWVVADHPDATLHPTGELPDSDLLALMGPTQWVRLDVSTLRGFEEYRGIETWTAEDAWGSPCLIAIDRANQTFLGGECTPPEGKLVTDIGVWPLQGNEFGEDLPAGSVIRFHHAGDTVDVFLFPSDGG